ncbi:MAG: alpha/beta hydrolase [Blastochloris sp.]|nr:alpha/beta hydrolase [Blastochloris sp.]
MMLYFAITDSSPIGYWRSVKGKEAYEEAYAAAMATLPVPTQTYDIPTSYGTVRVYAWLNGQHRSETPAVFLPGRSSGVPMWAENLPAIAATRPVYALDALGDASLSKQTVPLKNGVDQATWVEEVLSALQLESVHVVGHSFGGWAAANYASHYPKRVATLILLEPVVTFQGMQWDLILKTIPLALPFLPEAWREGALQDIGGGTPTDLTDPMARMIAFGFEYYAAKLPAPEQISQEQMQSWNMPVFVAMAGRSVFHDGAKAVAVANENVQYVQAKFWPNATHSLPMEVAPELNPEIVNFIDSNEPR